MLRRFLVIGLAFVIGCLPMAIASAERRNETDPWAIAAEALGVYAMYQSALTEILQIGNMAEAQMQCRLQDIEENGVDSNQLEVQLVDRIMEQLVRKGEYALKPNSLPFLWTVNGSKYFNACCYPTNYISVNRALVRGLRGDPDELASVLAHEMTHGLRQHSARNYAEAIARSMGMTLLGMESGNTDWKTLNGLVNYSIARDVVMPTETEADEGGFYLMTSAGFNPGGPAAAMIRMQRYLRYETQEIYEFDSPEKKRPDEYSDHPETGQRAKALAGLMTEYSCGHVTLEDGRNVMIDGRLLVTAMDSDGYQMDAEENACFIAGGLSKAFHDFDSIAGWEFRTLPNGEMAYLKDSPVYEKLRAYVADRRTAELLQEMVADAYAKEAGTGVRENMAAREQERREACERIQQEAREASKSEVKRFRYNCDAYADYGFSELALFEMERFFRCEVQDNPAESYVIRGRAKAVRGDFQGALADAERGIQMDGGNVLNYLNRSDIYRMMGDRERAMADSEMALRVNPESPVAWLVAAVLRDENGQKEQALAAYREYHRLAPKAEIPLEYLKEIDPKMAERIEKQKEEQRARDAEKRKEEKGKQDEGRYSKESFSADGIHSSGLRPEISNRDRYSAAGVDALS